MAWDVANPDDARARARKPLLIVDETTAHITVVAEQAAQLFAWFRGEGIACILQRRAGPADLDVVNFGDPSPAEERCIRRAFARWQKHNLQADRRVLDERSHVAALPNTLLSIPARAPATER